MAASTQLPTTMRVCLPCRPQTQEGLPVPQDLDLDLAGLPILLFLQTCQCSPAFSELAFSCYVCTFIMGSKQRVTPSFPANPWGCPTCLEGLSGEHVQKCRPLGPAPEDSWL